MAQEWTGFWAATGGIAATLLGLAFVTFQVRADLWRSERLKQFVAAFTLTELGAPVLVSLIFLMPGHPWRYAAGAIATVLSILVAAHVIVVAKTPQPDAFDSTQVQWSALTALVAVALASTIFIEDTPGLYVTAGAAIWLLVSGSIEAWLLLSPRGIATKEETADVSAVA